MALAMVAPTPNRTPLGETTTVGYKQSGGALWWTALTPSLGVAPALCVSPPVGVCALRISTTAPLALAGRPRPPAWPCPGSANRRTLDRLRPGLAPAFHGESYRPAQ